MAVSRYICILVVAVIVCLTHINAFRAPSSCRQMSYSRTLHMSDTEKPEGALVDKALDSALDFLQDGEADGEEEEADEFDMFDIFDESPDLDTPHDMIKSLEEKEAEFTATRGVLSADVHKKELADLIKKWQMHEGDVGSAEVQIAIADWKIKYLTTHLLNNKGDKSALRGLQAYVVRRRKFMTYLHDRNPEKAELMMKELGIRWRQPGKIWNKDTKYAAYKNTKSKWEKLRRIAKEEAKAAKAAKAERMAARDAAANA